MSASTEKYWEIAWEQLRKDGGFEVLTPEKADEEYANAPEMPLSAEEKDALIRRVMEAKDSDCITPSLPQMLIAPEMLPSTRGEFATLNRNKKEDSAAEKLLEKMRSEALNGCKRDPSPIGMEGQREKKGKG